MTSTITGFANRQNRATVLTFQFPEEQPPKGEPGDENYFAGLKPDIELKVTKLNEVQLRRVARFAGEKLATERGYKREDANWDEGANTCWLFTLQEMLRSAVTDWKSLTGEPLPKYSRTELDRYLDEVLISFENLMFFGLAYLHAHNAEEKKATASTSSEQGS
jgi:hypothetical protein